MKVPAIVIMGTALLLAGFGARRAYGHDAVPPPPPPADAGDPSPMQPPNSPGQDRPRGIQSNVSFSPAATGGPDQFGYQWDDSVAFNWKDPSGATEVFPGTSSQVFNASAGPFDLGFSFPFYEFDYTQVYIGSNGFLSFGEGSTASDNSPMPQDSPPDNIIAPFWDNLVIGGSYNSGVVSYMTGSDANGSFFAVNYVGVSRFDSPSDLLTFQVILYDNGDIVFQYNDLNGDLTSATVGIEDADAADGLLYLHNAPGLANGMAIEFSRPAASYRAKAWPTYVSGFVTGGSTDFLIFLRNSGENGPDSYNLTHDSTWTVTFLDGKTAQVLQDTDGDGNPNTASLPQGGTISVTVRLDAPGGSEMGDLADFAVTVASTNDPAKTSEVRIQAPIPARFLRVFKDGAAGEIAFERVMPQSQSVLNVEGADSDREIAVVADGGGRYIYAWVTATTPRNIAYTVVTNGGTTLVPATVLTNNSSGTFILSAPRLAMSRDGRMALIWTQFNTTWNVYFAILDRDGTVLLPPTNVTNNTDTSVSFDFPSVISNGANRFWLVWVKRIGATQSEVWNAMYNSDGSEVFEQDSQDNLAGGAGVQYLDLVLEQMSGDRMLIALTFFDTNAGTYSPVYAVFDETANDLQIPTEIPGANGWQPDIVQLGDQTVLIAWTNDATSQIEYALLFDDGDTLSYVPGSLTALQNPDGRAADFVSVTSNMDGFGILSWMDVGFSQRLYYALIDESGGLVTPPIISRSGVDQASPFVVSSSTAQGVAPLPPIEIFLPLVVR